VNPDPGRPKKGVSKKGKKKEISCFNELFEGLKASPPGAYTTFLDFIRKK
jgi:hypothetical protein